METLELPIQLRRDRGYVYFPDAIASTLSQFELSGPVRAECYKTSSKKIVAREIMEPQSEELFGFVECAGRGFAMLETSDENPMRYDLSEPVFDCRMTPRMMIILESSPFPSLFHRWAAACKKLYHHADPESGTRMLLQRIETFGMDLSGSETFTLDFLTPEKFMKFSIRQEGRLAGHVIAAAKVMRE